MKHEELIANLKKLHLTAIANDYAECARQCEQKNRTHEQYLAALVTAELNHRNHQKMARLTREAKLPRDKRIEAFDFTACEGVNLIQVKRLAEGEFIKKGGNVVLYGTFGVGKSHLAEGLTRSLCQKGYRCIFTSLAALIEELLTAQKSLTLTQTFRKFDRYDLVAIDELGYTPACKEGADLFFQLISQRYERKSIIITTNLTYSEWDKVFLNPITTAAAVDRIIHHCETFNVKGPSFRGMEAKKNMAKK
jgi:DNA replication protein DnaC